MHRYRTNKRREPENDGDIEYVRANHITDRQIALARYGALHAQHHLG
jgi:hypothetical protein